MKKRNIPILLQLFISFFKIGLFTFGGGYAMIPIIEEEVVSKKKWIREDDVLDILAISESTPGPIAVNTATYIGFKLKGVLGAVIATLGLALPSFVIIYLISLIYEQAMNLSIFVAAFKGIKIAVIILLFSAVLKLKKSLKLSYFTITIFIISLVTYLTLTLLSVQIPMMSLIFIGIGLFLGLISELIVQRKENVK